MASSPTPYSSKQTSPPRKLISHLALHRLRQITPGIAITSNIIDLRTQQLTCCMQHLDFGLQYEQFELFRGGCVSFDPIARPRLQGNIVSQWKDPVELSGID